MKTLQLLFVLSMAALVAATPDLSAAPAGERIRVILDTDANNELDDQHAIAYLLFNGQVFDVEGITVNRTRGGGDIQSQYAEALRVVQLCNFYPQIEDLAWRRRFV